MPCRYDPPGGSPEEKIRKQFRKDLDSLTRMLCVASNRLEKENLMHLLPDENKEWYENHKKQDAAREAEERKKKEAENRRKAALAKLSDEDKKILGIKD